MESSDNVLISKLCAILNVDKYRLWHVVVGFIGSVILSSLVSAYLENQSFERSLLAERSKPLSVAASEFENRINSLVQSGEAFPELEPKELEKLQENIEMQISAVNQIRPVLTSQAQSNAADKYALNLVKFREVIADGLSADETRIFGSLALELTVIRNQLLDELT